MSILVYESTPYLRPPEPLPRDGEIAEALSFKSKVL
jgi:hypothetical protein